MRTLLLSFTICLVIGCGMGKKAVYTPTLTRCNCSRTEQFHCLLWQILLQQKQQFIYADPLCFHYGEDSMKLIRMKVLDHNWRLPWKAGDTVDFPVVPVPLLFRFTLPYIERGCMDLVYENEQDIPAVFKNLWFDSIYSAFSELKYRGLSGLPMDTFEKIERIRKADSSLRIFTEESGFVVTPDEITYIATFDTVSLDHAFPEQTHRFFQAFTDWREQKERARFTGIDTLWIKTSEAVRHAVVAQFLRGHFHGTFKVAVWSSWGGNIWIMDAFFKHGRPRGDWHWWYAYDTVIIDPSGTKTYYFVTGMDTSKHLSDAEKARYRAMDYSEKEIMEEERNMQRIQKLLFGKEVIRWAEKRFSISPQGKPVADTVYWPHQKGFIAPDTITWQWREH